MLIKSSQKKKNFVTSERGGWKQQQSNKMAVIKKSAKPTKNKFQRRPRFSFFKNDSDRFKASDLAYKQYAEFENFNKYQKPWNRVPEPRHSVIFRTWGYNKEEVRKRALAVISKNKEHLAEGDNFKKKRGQKQFRKIFHLLSENRPFWTVDWWKMESKVITNPQWNWHKVASEDVEYQFFYRSLRGAAGRLKKNFKLKRFKLKGRVVHFFIKGFFKVLFKQVFGKLYKNAIKKGINYFFNFFKQLQLLYSNYAKTLPFVFNRDTTPTRAGAYFMTNMAFSTIYFDEKPDFATSFLVDISPTSIIKSKALATAFLTKGPRSRYHSAYYKFNSFLLIRYFLITLKQLFGFKNGFKAFRIVKLISKTANKRAKLDLSFPITNKKKRVLRKRLALEKKLGLNKNYYKKIFYTLLLAIKNNFISKFNEQPEQRLMRKSVVFPNQPRLIKTITGARGYFYRLRKRTPKYFKSNRKLLLFKKYVRRYKYSVRAHYNFKKIIGVASHYFQVVGVKKLFRQKIYYRALFKHKYRAADDTKMYNRWKAIRKSNSIWIGFYKNFEGLLWRALRWLGFSNKVKLSNFLVESGLIFINGRVCTNPRAVVNANNLIYLRKDIYNLIQKKIWNTLIKRAISAVPFYHTLLKDKLVRKAAWIGRGLLRKSPFFSNLHEKRILRVKKILRLANFNLTEKNYGVKSYPKLLLDRKQWRRHLKKISSFKLRLAKKMLLKREILHSANSNYNTTLGNETFMFKKKNMVMMYAKPRSIEDFFNTSAVKYKKTFNPNVIRDFSERTYRY